jgi:hypothetical protein
VTAGERRARDAGSAFLVYGPVGRAAPAWSPPSQASCGAVSTVAYRIGFALGVEWVRSRMVRIGKRKY